MLSLISSCLRHIAELDVNVVTKEQYHAVLRAVGQPAPNLHTFKLLDADAHWILDDGTGAQGDDYVPWLIPEDAAINIFGGEDPPNLTVFEIISPWLGPPVGFMRHLTQLSVSSFERASPVQILQMLENVPLLSILHLEDWTVDALETWGSDDPIDVITLPLVTDVVLNGDWVDPLLSILHHLHLPNLQFLRLEFYDESYISLEVEPAPIMPFPLLENLELSNRDLRHCTCDEMLPPHLYRLLQRCASLKSLTLERLEMAPLLVLTGGDPSLPVGKHLLCPNLVDLRIIGWDRKHALLLKFLQRRMQDTMASTIRTLAFDSSPIPKVSPSPESSPLLYPTKGYSIKLSEADLTEFCQWIENSVCLDGVQIRG